MGEQSEEPHGRMCSYLHRDIEITFDCTLMTAANVGMKFSASLVNLKNKLFFFKITAL